MPETKRIEKTLVIDDLVDALTKSGKFKPDEIQIAKTKEGFFVQDYTVFRDLVKTLREHVTVETLPGVGIPTVKVAFYRNGEYTYSFQSHNEGIPNR